MVSGEYRCPASREQFRELHAQQPRSASTAEAHRQMAEGTYDYSRIQLDQEVSQNEAQKLWDDKGKPERYTIMRLLSKPVVDDTIEQHRYTPATLVTSVLEQEESFKNDSREIIGGFRETVRILLYQQIDMKLNGYEDLLQTNPSSPYAMAYKKHMEWIDFFNSKQLTDNTLSPGNEMPLRGTIGSGLKTGTHMMAGMIKVIPQLLYEAKGGKVSIDECMRTANNSESFFNSLAVLDIPSFKIVIQSFAHSDLIDPFDSLDNFSLTESDDGYRVELPHAVIETALGMFALSEYQDEISATQRVRCPGLLNASIKALWQWHLDNAEILWKNGVLHNDIISKDGSRAPRSKWQQWLKVMR